MKKRLVLCAFFIFVYTGELLAQLQAKSKNKQITHNKHKLMTIAKPKLFQYGVASAFIDGLYEGELPANQLKQHGNFGIGAPNIIDGELTIIDGKVYQSKANGQTIEAPDSLKTPLAFVTTFKADTMYSLSDIQDVKDLFAQLEKLLPNPNAIYALHIKGTFTKVQTRAFPPVAQKPFKPLAQLLNEQHFFEFKETDGDMIGFYIPAYLSGINIVGLHFHFLSKSRKAGGHVIGVQAKNISIEIAELNEFHLLPPATKDFERYKFNGVNSPNLQKVEKGSD